MTTTATTGLAHPTMSGLNVSGVSPPRTVRVLTSRVIGLSPRSVTNLRLVWTR